jgi:transcriptional regulator with XRE-family HTH domain
MKNTSGRKNAHVGEIIRRRREQLGLTQQELAARLGAERFLDSLIRLLEDGKAQVPPARVLAFARALQLDEVWFVELVMHRMPGFGPLHAWLFGPDGQLRERLEQGQNVVQASFGNDAE